MRLGIFGGTFDPVHNGHVNAARIFRKKLQLDLVLFVPSAAPFYKTTCETSYEHRYAMCLLATDEPGMAVSNIERGSSSGMYMCDVVAALHDNHPENEFFLLMSDDLLRRLPQWKDFNAIRTNCVIAVLQRSRKADDARLPVGTRCIKLDDPILPLSSTDVRKAVANGMPINTMVPPAVAEYILENRLYTGTRSYSSLPMPNSFI